MKTPFFAPRFAPGMTLCITSCAVLATIAASALAQGTTTNATPNPNPSWDDQWPTLESEFLSDQVQLTSEQQFIKAGESYFSPDGNMIIFQAIPTPPEGQEAGEHYLMYVATVTRDEGGTITGLGHPGLISTPNSANTCGWFHPSEPMTVLFGSTRIAPNDQGVAGYQRDSSKYAWQFPVEMDILSGKLTMSYALSGEAQARADEYEAKRKNGQEAGEMPKLSMDDFVSVPTLRKSEPLWQHQGYDAEGSWSPDGRFIVYTRLEPDSDDGDIWVFDTQDKSQTPLVAQKGYDGGPFFSPDGKSICYRSDRRGDNLLQIFVAPLAFDDSGKITGIEREIQLTDNEHVNWCPFWTPDGKYLLFASSEVSHANYEIYAIDASGEYKPEFTPHLRVTRARGFDGLPALSHDGKWMIWTAQRGQARPGEERPSSQVWGARIDLDAIDKAYQKLVAQSE